MQILCRSFPSLDSLPSYYPIRVRAAALLGLLFGPWLSWQTAWSAEPATPPHVNDNTAAQRELYRDAREALDEGRRDEYEGLLEQLNDYPLLPYLEYLALSDRLAELPHAEVERFLAQYSDSYLAGRLEREWVAELVGQERWADVVRYHDPANSTTVLRCQALKARLETGDRSALADVAPLWNVSRSQPNECDPVFEVWLDEGLLTPEIAWDRFDKVLQAGRRGLARYIAGLMEERERELAELYLAIDSEPERLADHAALGARNGETRRIIQHGVRRLASIDAPYAMMMLNRHARRQDFDEGEVVTLQRFIAMRLLLQGFVSETESLLRNTPELATESLITWLLRDALAKEDWDRVETWLAELPPGERDSERWSYWRARMLEQKGSEAALAEAQSLYRSLAGNRSFYGFLSADRLGLDYELVDRPVTVNGSQLQALYERPGIVRAYELYRIGDEANARNEWRHATLSLSQEEIVSSGKLADSWGWHRMGIQAMIRVGYWDDLELRFPLAYDELFANAASEHALQPHLLLAVARQESAFMHDVRSPAGARGLMQLMPGTARQTADALGMQPPSAQDLYEPEINIRLGSRYMAELMEEFDGNRAVAAAAYNAGPNRVKQWMRRGGDNALPLDKWIETLPFAETRGYVQNVLAYSLIYRYRMGDTIAFLTEEEAASRF